ncbi:MAG: recombinase family protein [Lentisphaeria bacterium]|nr:recombinase family protein [Lentisphaeria bacterium]
MKALIYARQSSGKDDVSESVEAQISNCVGLAQQKNLEIIGIYRDLNNSGELYPEGAEKIAELDDAYQSWMKEQSGKKGFRKGLGELLKKLPEANILLVNEMTRLYRPVNHSFLENYIHNLLRINGITIFQFQGEEIDLRRFDQHLIVGMKNSILYEDLKKKRQNSINAFRIKRDSGKLCCGTRIFAINYCGKDKLSVDQEKAEIVREVFSGILSGKPLNSIVRSCNQKNGSLIMYPSLLYSIAAQPLYAGMQYNTGGELIKNIQITGQELISENDWFAVQEIMKKKKKKQKNKKSHWLPMSGRLICGVCGSRLVCRIDHGKVCYSCNRQKFDPSHASCNQSRIRFESGAYGEYALYDAVLPLLLIGVFRKYSPGNRHLLTEDFSQKIINFFLNSLITKQELKEIYFQAEQSGSGNDIFLSEYTIRKIILCKIRQIADRKITHSFFEEFLYWSEIKAVVNQGNVEFQTSAGNIEIPRLWNNGRVWMPHWTLRIRKTIDCLPGVIICYHTGKNKILGNFGRIKVLTN